jgi:hypothetical protein
MLIDMAWSAFRTAVAMGTATLLSVSAPFGEPMLAVSRDGFLLVLPGKLIAFIVLAFVTWCMLRRR